MKSSQTHRPGDTQGLFAKIHPLMKGWSMLMVFLVWVIVITSCASGTGSVRSTSPTASWVKIVGAGVGTILEQNLLQSQLVMVVPPELKGCSAEKIASLAIQDALNWHKTVTYHRANPDQWVQADPLIYEDTDVKVRIRVWKDSTLIKDETRKIKLL